MTHTHVNMAGSFTFVDDLIRDYMNYRGLTTTLRTFEIELAKLPIGPLRADRITEQLTLYIHQFDIVSLIEYWTQVEQRLVSTLILHSQQQTSSLAKIRTNLYRCYLVHTIQSSRVEKVHEFFDRLAKTLQQSPDWTKEWFALPFIKNPEENSTFQLYFTKQWNDLFWISLQNFLSVAFYHMTPPRICSMEESSALLFGNQISQQIVHAKSSLPPSARVDPSMTQFAEVLDEIQISSSPASVEQRQSNPTIISKFRNNFLLNTKQRKLLGSSSHAKSNFVQPAQESTTGNQIQLSTDESTTPPFSSTPTAAMHSASSLLTRSKAATFSQDESHFDFNEERLIHLADLQHHSATIMDCQLNNDGTFYSTLDVQNQVKIWSATEDFDVITSLISRSAPIQCQTFDTREPLLYLGTLLSTIKVLHITEKRIINEAIIDQNYPRIMCLHPHMTQDRLFVSLASASRLSPGDYGRTRAGRVSILDLKTWTVERVLVDDSDNYVTCLTVHPDRQLLILGFSDGKVMLYDARSNTVAHQRQQHPRLVQDIHVFGDDLYSIGNDNTIVQANLASFDQLVQTYQLPYSAVGPFQTSSLSSPGEGPSLPSPSQARMSTVASPLNSLLPMGHVFDRDPYDPDRFITCSATNARFYRLSLADEDPKLHLPSKADGSPQSMDTMLASTCVHWNRDRDTCMAANTNGCIQLYRRENRLDL